MAIVLYIFDAGKWEEKLIIIEMSTYGKLITQSASSIFCYLYVYVLPLLYYPGLF